MWCRTTHLALPVPGSEHIFLTHRSGIVMYATGMLLEPDHYLVCDLDSLDAQSVVS
jgi:hypothetical protein